MLSSLSPLRNLFIIIIVCVSYVYMGTCMCQAHMSKPEDDFEECILSFIFTWATEIKLKLPGLCGQPFTYRAMSQPCFLLVFSLGPRHMRWCYSHLR